MIALAVVFTAASICLAACGAGKGRAFEKKKLERAKDSSADKGSKPSNKKTKQEEKKAGYSFRYKETNFALNAEAGLS